MKLIDADKLVEHNKTFAGNVFITQSDIDKEPTVKAIPIEWIVKWAWAFMDKNSEGYKMAMELLHDWEKENGKR